MKGPIQQNIMRKLLYQQDCAYHELWDHRGSSSLFDYHLKQLLEDGLVMKKGDRYTLSPKGLQFASALDGETVEERARPVVCAFVLAQDDQGRILVNRRKKQPFIGVIGIPGGKLELGERLGELAAKELLEETGLHADHFTLKLVTNYRTFDGDALAHQIIGFFYYATGLHGSLLRDHREGENFFIFPNDKDRFERYPDFDFFTETLLRQEEGIVFQEADRFLKDGVFQGITFL